MKVFNVATYLGAMLVVAQNVLQVNGQFQSRATLMCEDDGVSAPVQHRDRWDWKLKPCLRKAATGYIGDCDDFAIVSFMSPEPDGFGAVFDGFVQKTDFYINCGATAIGTFEQLGICERDLNTGLWHRSRQCLSGFEGIVSILYETDRPLRYDGRRRLGRKKKTATKAAKKGKKTPESEVLSDLVWEEVEVDGEENWYVVNLPEPEVF